MKPRNFNKKNPIKVVNDKYVDCLIGFSYQLRECIPVFVINTPKSRNAYWKTTNHDVQQSHNNVKDDDDLQEVQSDSYIEDNDGLQGVQYVEIDPKQNFDDDNMVNDIECQ